MARCDECGAIIDERWNNCPHCGEKVRRSGCFIATACYGIESDEVKILRQWRDNTLLKNPVGKQFVKVYYNISPPIANFISNKPFLKGIVRFVLYPLKEIVK